MTRFSGVVGYAHLETTAPGVQSEVMTEVSYIGDVIRDIARLEPSSEQVNPNQAVNQSIAVVANAYGMENVAAMRYVRWNGQNWRITSVEVRRPRLILSIGELWNGNTA